MSRSVPYRFQVNDIVNWRQTQALSATIFILRNLGPTSFLLQEEGEEKKYKVLIGDPHSCSCHDFRKDKDLCKHICWVLLKKYRLDKDDPLSWQLGLVEREVNDLLFPKIKTKPTINRRQVSSDSTTLAAAAAADSVNDVNSQELVKQRAIGAEDVCPICQDNLLPDSTENVDSNKKEKMPTVKRLPVTFCRGSCGNNVHIRCMRVWVEHQKKQNQIGYEDQIPCPICRGSFSTYSHLLQEIACIGDQRTRQRLRQTPGEKTTTNEQQNWFPLTPHTGTQCNHCQRSPVLGKLYKCDQCVNFVLCGQCFNSGIHNEHRFIYRERPHGRWLAAPFTRGVPEALIQSLQRRELSDHDYNLLLQLDEPVEGSELRQTDVERLPTWNLRSDHRLLQPGNQCRVCLMNYQLGDTVRRLPSCSHIFHSRCVDPWLLHRTASCPLCGAAISIQSKTTNTRVKSVNNNTIVENRPRLSAHFSTENLATFSLNGIRVMNQETVENSNFPRRSSISHQTFPSSPPKQINQSRTAKTSASSTTKPPPRPPPPQPHHHRQIQNLTQFTGQNDPRIQLAIGQWDANELELMALARAALRETQPKNNVPTKPTKRRPVGRSNSAQGIRGDTSSSTSNNFSIGSTNLINLNGRHVA